MIQYTWIGEIPSEDMVKLQKFTEKFTAKFTEGTHGTLLELPNHHRYSIRISKGPTDTDATITRG